MSNLQQTIACVILTKDEEQNIQRSLESVAWCHEVVVVDSGSADRTKQIATSNRARVIEHIQNGPFNIAEQRNWALSYTEIKSDWVLFLDADEEVPGELRRKLESILSVEQKYNAYELTPKYIFWGRWLKRTQGYPNWHARLIKRREAGFSGGVWEHFDERAIIGRISVPYNHYANSKGFADWLQRHNRYSTWDAERIVAYLKSGNGNSLGTSRKLKLRKLAARFYIIRPFVRVAVMLFWRCGILEGLPAIIFSIQYFMYETFTVFKVVELLRVNAGKEI